MYNEWEGKEKIYNIIIGARFHAVVRIVTAKRTEAQRKVA